MNLDITLVFISLPFCGHTTLLKKNTPRVVVSSLNIFHIHVFNPKCKTNTFSFCIIQALHSFRQTVIDLYLAPRIQEPVWLSMMTLTSKKVKLCERFLKEFMVAKDKYESRNNRL